MPKPKSMGFRVLSRMSSCANIVRIAIIANVFPTAEAKRAFLMAGMCSAHAAKKKPTITDVQNSIVRRVVITMPSEAVISAITSAIVAPRGKKKRSIETKCTPSSGARNGNFTHITSTAEASDMAAPTM